MKVRNEAQDAVVQLYMELDLLKSCGVLSTGFGKSKVAIDIIKKLESKKVLILVNSTILRDFNWEREFVKWEEEELFSRVELSTYQAAYKWTKDSKNLDDYFVIADECDFAADTEELSKFFYEYPEVRVLGLTGFITATKRAWFETHLPVFTELTADMAQKMKILNNIHFVFVKYDLSNNPKDIKVEYKVHKENKSFYQSENNAYDYANKKSMYLISESAKLNLDFMQGIITKAELDSGIKSFDYKIRIAVAARNDVLLKSISSVQMTKKLLAHIQNTQPDSKVIIFSKRTEQSLAICGEDYVYNGKITKKKALSNFTDFESGKKKVLGVCDKVNRGANIEDLDTAILETFYGSDTQASQRFGRLMRLKPNQMATVYILLPYYMRKEVNNTYTLQETQQVKWARAMLGSTTIKSSTIWNYCVVKSKLK
jgi:superfamily II DNA or RNA helicase